jgi:hypothetical protein
MAPSKKPPRKSVKLKSLKRKSVSVRVTKRVKGGTRILGGTNDDSI